MAYKSKKKKLEEAELKMKQLKYSPNKSPLQLEASASGSGEPSDTGDTDVIETDIQGHDMSDMSFSERAKQKLAGIISPDSDGANSPDSEQPKKKYYNSYAKKKAMEQQGELATLFTSVLVIATAVTPVHDAVKPNDDELGALSERIARILNRHGLLTGKFSGDALDTVAIIAICASWYSRVQPEIRSLREQRLANTSAIGQTGQPNSYVQANDEAANGRTETPIDRASQATGGWLNNVLNNNSGEE